MKAVIICSSNGNEWVERFFAGMNKYLLPVLGKPLIEHYLDFCAISKVKDILIITDDFDQSLCNFVGSGLKWGLNIEFSADSATSELSEILLHHSAYANYQLLVINGFFFPLYDKRKICANAPNSPRIFLHTPEGTHLEQWKYPECSPLEIDSIKDYYKLNIALLKEKSQQLVMKGYSSESDVFLGMNDAIMHRAELKAPLILGDNVQIERNVRIDGGVIIDDTCIIDRGSRLKDTILFPRTYIGTDLDLESKIVFRNCIIDPLKELTVHFSDASFASEVKISGLNGFLHRIVELAFSSCLIAAIAPLFAAMRLVGEPDSEIIKLPSLKGGGRTFAYRKYRRGKNIANIWFFKLSLDRLPMLFAVIAGNAKLIGDTPLDCSKNKEMLSHYEDYTPGAFFYSDSLGHSDTYESVLDDLFYRHHKSCKNDMQIILCSLVRRLFGWEEKQS